MHGAIHAVTRFRALTGYASEQQFPDDIVMKAKVRSATQRSSDQH
jgi:hypothetical protein